jgi:hypothetical protein
MSAEYPGIKNKPFACPWIIFPVWYWAIEATSSNNFEELELLTDTSVLIQIYEKKIIN